MTDLAAWKAALQAKDDELQLERSRLLAAKDDMEPAIAARALRTLADKMDALQAEWLDFAEEIRRGKS